MRDWRWFVLVLGVLWTSTAAAQDPVSVDASALAADSEISVSAEADRVQVRWPMGQDRFGRVVLRVAAAGPLIESMQIESAAEPLVAGIDPVAFLTVGSRQGTKTDGWMVFFDRVHQRPFQTHQARLMPQRVRLRSTRWRAVVEIDELVAGPFRGHWEFQFYAGSPLVKIDAVLKTDVDRRAILYDAGLAGELPCWDRLAWRYVEDGEDKLALRRADAIDGEPAVATRGRAVAASAGGGGSLAVFPPPHQFFYPLDNSTNLKFNWVGSGFHGERRFGMGIRQHPQGDERLVPWFNAPPGTAQRLGMFVLLSESDPPGALDQVGRYTRHDRFKPLQGYRTFTSHYHLAHTMDVWSRPENLRPGGIPEFATVFRRMGVNIVHLAEFHGDGNPRDPGPLRLPQLDRMHAECRRLSDSEFLLLPGEEPNVHLGGHWMSFFPAPVYWIMGRREGEPFVEEDPRYGKVYRVGSAAEMHRLLHAEQGLAWTAHARIKGSHGFPDQHRGEPFFVSDRFLGAAWKAMPGDLSRPRLGERVLDLLDDMSNWAVATGSQQSAKYVLGEVDVFKIDSSHELFGHMNINYVRLDRLPEFDEGWSSVLAALRGGQFFVTTGEILIPEFTVGDARSGQRVKFSPATPPELMAQIEGTFPLAFAQIVTGDGEHVYRQTIDLGNSSEFEDRTLRLTPELAGRRWVRLEVWDIAANGAFTQPVWID